MALPHRLDLITSRLAANEFETQVEVPQLTLMMEALQKVANRVFSGLVLAGLLVASAMLMPYRRALGTAGFVLSGAIGALDGALDPLDRPHDGARLTTDVSRSTIHDPRSTRYHKSPTVNTHRGVNDALLPSPRHPASDV